MKVTEIVNNMEYELKGCVNCNKLTPNRQYFKGLDVAMCNNCIREEYVNGESF